MLCLTFSVPTSETLAGALIFILTRYGAAGEFPIEVAQKFVTKVEELEQQLKQQNITYKATSHKNVYQKPVVKQVTLFYYADNQKIVFLRFWNNKKDPKTLKF